ncbi:hypothetical protein BC829DRAFT_488484 [Chytridium lagenaria]|nr:hypothetical protein BC829DRAFT_488484 [Chytridium lagenaria]
MDKVTQPPTLISLPAELLQCIAVACSIPRSRYLLQPPTSITTPSAASSINGVDETGTQVEGTVIISSVNVDKLPTPILSLQDVIFLSSACKKLRSILTDPNFGARYLTRDVASLTVSVTIRTPVSSFDTFDYGILLPPKELFEQEASPLDKLHQSLHRRMPCPLERLFNLVVYFYIREHIRPQGLIHLLRLFMKRRLPKPATCTALSRTDLSLFDANESAVFKVNNFHRANCKLCGTAKVAGICAHVDKNFRVFLQSWLDSRTIISDDGLRVIINLMHVPPADAGALWHMMGDPSTPATSDSEGECGDEPSSFPVQSNRAIAYVPKVLRSHKGIWNPPSAVVEVTREQRRIPFMGKHLKTVDTGKHRDSVSSNPPVRRTPIYNPWQ